jgi:hypothetical protein
MTESNSPDPSCVPYRRKGLYWALTLPFLGLLLGVTAFLGSASLFLSMGMVLLFLSLCAFQAYCCAYQDCPYVGGFCPAVIGILPANWIARALYGSRPVVKSRRRFALYAGLGMLSWAGLILLPLIWLGRLGIGYAIGYVAAHAVYAAVFGLTICPLCAIRETCPGGAFHRLFQRTGDGG